MDAFIGEIKAFSFGYPPVYWLPCDGKEYPINQFPKLFSVIGNIYGGTLGKTFQVPDLQGRVPLSFSPDFRLSKKEGTNSVALSLSEMPAHSHSFNTLQPKDFSKMTNQPDKTTWLTIGYSKGLSKAMFAYSDKSADEGMILNPGTIANTGGGEAHENRMSYLCMTCCICYDSDYYPQRP